MSAFNSEWLKNKNLKKTAFCAAGASVSAVGGGLILGPQGVPLGGIFGSILAALKASGLKVNNQKALLANLNKALSCGTKVVGLTAICILLNYIDKLFEESSEDKNKKHAH